MPRIIGVLLAFVLTASATEPLVLACATTAAHGCCTGERIASGSANTRTCCVSRAPGDASTPAATRVTPVAAATTPPPVAGDRAAADLFASTRAPLRSLPRARAVDLPTLFSVLLI